MTCEYFSNNSPINNFAEYLSEVKGSKNAGQRIKKLKKLKKFLEEGQNDNTDPVVFLHDLYYRQLKDIRDIFKDRAVQEMGYSFHTGIFDLLKAFRWELREKNALAGSELERRITSRENREQRISTLVEEWKKRINQILCQDFDQIAYDMERYPINKALMLLESIGLHRQNLLELMKVLSMTSGEASDVINNFSITRCGELGIKDVPEISSGSVRSWMKSINL